MLRLPNGQAFMTRPFRRRILYIPGYDPLPPRRYRETFRSEGATQAMLSGYRLQMGPRGDATDFGWGVRGDFPEGRSECDFEVLVWSDIVQGSMGHGILATYGQMLRTAAIYLGSGALWRMTRLRRGPVLAALYPVAVLLAQLLLALALGGIAGGLLASLTGLGLWVSLPVAGVLAWALLRLFRRADSRFMAWYLMHDFAFIASGAGAWPPALDRRLDQFAARLGQVLRQDWDEILVVGHSTGACLAVSAVARAMKDAPKDARLSLLTLGQVVPMMSFLPRARGLRRDLRLLSINRQVDWVDVSAPGDPCCFGLCDPVAVSGVRPPQAHQPLILSAAFSRSLSRARLQALRGRWLRIHFQYLCAFDRPQGYDYFAITAGPLPLARRYRDRSHSPGRIDRPVSPWTTT